MEQLRAGPQVQIEAVACRKSDIAGHWLVSWHIETPEEQTLEIQAAWLPHDKFHSDRQGFEPPLHLNKNESATLELLVACKPEDPENHSKNSSNPHYRADANVRWSDRSN